MSKWRPCLLIAGEELTQAESPQPPPIATPGQTLLPRDEDAQ